MPRRGLRRGGGVVVVVVVGDDGGGGVCCTSSLDGIDSVVDCVVVGDDGGGGVCCTSSLDGIDSVVDCVVDCVVGVENTFENCGCFFRKSSILDSSSDGGDVGIFPRVNLSAINCSISASEI